MITDKYIFFYNGIFSQWYPVDFSVNNVGYNCAEQYMMAGKATLFKDWDSYDKIMATDDPGTQKSIGKKVKNFDLYLWNTVAKTIVYKGNEAKFTQTPDLLNQLLQCENKILVETSPIDKIWGIGLSEDNPIEVLTDENKWNGTNWLGEVLTRLKDDIRGPYLASLNRVVYKHKCLSQPDEVNKRWVCIDYKEKCHPCYNENDLIRIMEI